jgi:ribosome-binding protein aMBF1 (putative translation factor)
MTYIPVFQEWDILKETHKELEQKIEKTTNLTNRPSFGFMLQQARIKKRMTTMDVANSMRITAKMVSLYENGTEIPNTATADALRYLLDV